MKLEIHDSAHEVSRTVATLIADAIAQKPDVVLAVPTGRTQVALYRELITLTHVRQLNWSRVRTFNLDEFLGVSRDTPGSYRRFMQEHLYSQVNIDPANTDCPRGETTDVDAECVRYEHTIESAGGLDLAILGLGSNAHIAFNEPAAVLVGPTHRVTLDEPSRAANAAWFGGDMNRVPREALTMGVGTLLKARQIVMVAVGGEKADAVKAMVEGGITTAVPASLLQLHRHARVIVDRPAAAKLGVSERR